MTDFDVSEFRALAADLETAGKRLPDEARKTVKKAAQNIKTTMQDDAKSSGAYKHFAGSISYTMQGNAAFSSAEIGPDKGRTQGALGNILYFGTSKNGPVLNVEVGLAKEAPEFERRIGEMTEGLLDG